MSEKESQKKAPEHLNQLTHDEISEIWKHYLTHGQPPDFAPGPWYKHKWLRPWVRHVPSGPRCRLCYYSFEGVGGTLSKILFGVQRSRTNPHFCNQCEQIIEKMPTGAEIEVTVLFADVRGSTGLAESMSPVEFSKLINRFYNMATEVLFDTNAIVEKLVGDAVTGFYPPGYVGQEHARVAVDAARQILKKSGFGGTPEPWVPVGIGVHTGVAYVGAVTSDSGVNNISVLGDTANIGARLAALAGKGEIYLSQATADAAKLDTGELQHKHLTLKGRSQPVDAWVLSV